ncbi:MAG: ATP-grasp domain-containing protein [Acidimicrobiales bacterium]
MANGSINGADGGGLAPPGPRAGLVPPTRPAALVLMAAGGAQGALGMVRSLGRAGVRVIVVTEDPSAPLLKSRHVQRVVPVESFNRRPTQAAAVVEAVAGAEAGPPVLFPTADPDLGMITDHRDRLEPVARYTSPQAPVVEVCLDKGRFFAAAAARELPVAPTLIPRSVDDLAPVGDELGFPVILKPLNPRAWAAPEIRSLVDRRKALLIDDRAGLDAAFRAIARHDGEMVVQEYIPGRDDNLYSVHLYLDRSGVTRAGFVGRKIRTYPAYAGIGCCVTSVERPDLITLSETVLTRLGYTGIALLQYKIHEGTGRPVLLEINARTSSWNHLATFCGVDIPLTAYRDAVGEDPGPPPTGRAGVTYIYARPDRLAAPEYLRSGDWTVAQWLRSYRRPHTFQLWSAEDPWPLLTTLHRRWRAFPGRIRSAVRRRRASPTAGTRSDAAS